MIPQSKFWVQIRITYAILIALTPIAFQTGQRGLLKFNWWLNEVLPQAFSSNIFFR